MSTTLSLRPDPTLRFVNSLIVRTEYVAECSGIHLMQNREGATALLLSFMEGKPSSTPLPSLNEGWSAISLKLSPEDARAFGKELIRLADAERQKEE